MIAIRTSAVTALLLSMAGCTLAPLAPEAAQVKVLTAAPDGCTPANQVEVSVTDGFAAYKRNPLRVKDELETLARNQAAKLGADAIVPVTRPDEGRQRFDTYRCVRNR